MIEKQIHYKSKNGVKSVCVGFYDRSFKDYVFKFTEEEMKNLFRRLGVKYKSKTAK